MHTLSDENASKNEGPTNCSVDDLFWMGETLVCATHRGMFSNRSLGRLTDPRIQEAVRNLKKFPHSPSNSSGMRFYGFRLFIPTQPRVYPGIYRLSIFVLPRSIRGTDMSV